MTNTFFVGDRVEMGEGRDRRLGRVCVASGDRYSVTWDDGPTNNNLSGSWLRRVKGKEASDARGESPAPAPGAAEDLSPWGWAPGGYVFRCHECGPQSFLAKPTGDKRSWRCEMHARAAKARYAPKPGEGASMTPGEAAAYAAGEAAGYARGLETGMALARDE